MKVIEKEREKDEEWSLEDCRVLRRKEKTMKTKAQEKIAETPYCIMNLSWMKDKHINEHITFCNWTFNFDLIEHLLIFIDDKKNYKSYSFCIIKRNWG